MQGTITSYLPEKRYGFIKGKDGKDYFFHDSSFKNDAQIALLAEEAMVTFEQQATPKGYKATHCSLLHPTEAPGYITPDEFMTSGSESVRGWDIVELGDWIVHGASRESPNEARRQAIEHARGLGANALLKLEYYKTTGAEAGTGRGTHRFTIHHFRGRVATLAKRHANGDHEWDELTGLNQRARAAEQTQQLLAQKKRKVTWKVVLLCSLITLFIHPLFIIMLVGMGFLYNRKKHSDTWLEPILK
ncbi:cold-shock protein [Aeromonas encheleia]